MAPPPTRTRRKEPVPASLPTAQGRDASVVWVWHVTWIPAKITKPTSKFPEKTPETKGPPGSNEKPIEKPAEPASKPQQRSRKPASRSRKKAKKIREDNARN